MLSASIKRAAFALAFLAAAGVGAQALAQDYGAALTASPDNYAGPCPTTIKFNGTITARKAGKVQYKFIRSDNAFAPVQTLEFAAPGSKPVTTTWTLGGASLPTYSGWEAIQIVYPTSLQSNQAKFSIKCAAAALAPSKVITAVPALLKPEITGYRHAGKCVAKGSPFTIVGKNFGTQTGKGAALGGHGIHVDLPVASWSDTAIQVTLPDVAQIQEGQWYYTGVEKNDHSGWLSNINKNITVCRAPARAKPDLVIRTFGLKQWGECKPNSPIATFQVTVANIGSAPSPAIADKALVQVKDQHAVNWGNGAKLGAIAPGGSQTVDIPVYYLQADPAHMTSAAPHPFKAIADPLSLVAESNEGNNQSTVVNVDPRKLCKK